MFLQCCKKVSIFVGKPNTGKSNILESVGIFSLTYGNLKDFVRFENMTNLFYDQDLGEKIEITADDIYFEIKLENGRFIGSGGDEEKKFFILILILIMLETALQDGKEFPPSSFIDLRGVVA